MPANPASCHIDVASLLTADASIEHHHQMMQSQKSALLNMTGTILLIFVVWAMVLLCSVAMIVSVLLLRRLYHSAWLARKLQLVRGHSAIKTD